MAQIGVAPREWRWLAVASLVVMLATSVPYTVGWLTSTPDMRYGGFVLAHEDMHSYLAKMRYGARDGWLFQLVYTSEPNRGALVYAFHLALGKLAALLAGHPPPVTALVATYHTARIACGLLVLAASYRFVAEFLPDTGQRRLAWTLVAVGGGLGWLVLPLFGSEWLGSLPNEFYIPEGYTFLSLLLLPHLALARALLLSGWLALLRAAQQESLAWAALAGLAWLVMGAVVPFYVALVDTLLGVWLAALWLRQRTLPLRESKLAALPILMTGAVLAYNGWAFTRDPVFRAWSAQNDLPSPHPLHYLFGYGILAFLSAWGVRPVWRGDARHGALLVGWTLVAPALVYLPINVQRRLAEGVLVPLSILTVTGLTRLSAGWQAGRRRLATSVLLASLLPSSLMLVIGAVLAARTPSWPMYHSRDELAALAWLETNAPPDSIVLSSFEEGNVLPAYADVRVYAGHGPETVHSTQKRARVAAFFGGAMSDQQRAALLAESRARYVFVGPPEADACPEAGCFDPDRLGLEKVFSQGDYTIFEIPS